MAQRYEDLDDGARIATSNLLDNMDMPESRGHNTEFGMCSRCKSFAISRTEFKVVRACCMAQHNYLIGLTAAQPVTECNLFADANVPELWEMRQIAAYIDAPARKAGFITDDD